MVLGIDIGSMAISAVLIDEKGKVSDSFYEFHEGQIAACLERLKHGMNGDGIKAHEHRIALTSSSRLSINGIESLNIQTALVKASRHQEQIPNHILHVGAEKFYLIRLGPEGRYESSRTNTSCAAGTGSFLDQQSRRLQIPSIEEFCRLAAKNKGKVPDIASRCSVFAKTDLIHAQQEGYPAVSICDGLCKGLARNLTDTLFHDFEAGQDILFTGGVSKNTVVQRYIEEMLEAQIQVHPLSHLFGALGAGLQVFNNNNSNHTLCMADLTGHYLKPVNDRKYYYPPLKSSLNNYPDFSKAGFRVEPPGIKGFSSDLQTEEFLDASSPMPKAIYIGIDIGSTSTKAVVCSPENEPLLGYYTYTSGKPIEAVFTILEAFDRYKSKSGWEPDVLGVGTTGSGRQLAGQILDADLILDEITAHASAAVHLEPEIDTIIEIGGQDAKFTVLNRGEVVFSQMNAVCAAGTGSFIEEQAKKLGVPLKQYAERVMNQKSPLTSDRCTVFMERDLNHLINLGYTVEELLAAVLYSVRENYFKKVAIEGMIGDRICFQGATAKNPALVSVFEQKLEREIYVSRYCHLTGALGVCLTMKEEGTRKSRFRGIGIYRETIPVSTELCEFCNNRCKLTIARVREENVAFGFLCGRDYETAKFKPRKQVGFDLLKERKKTFPPPVRNKHSQEKPIPVLGIPSALHMFEESRFWQHFFSRIGIQTILSNPDRNKLKDGKNLAGAEFCAPIESMYGHVKDLSGKADYIFLPVYLESRERTGKEERNYCYYTQYSPSIASQIEDGRLMNRFIIPEIDFSRSPRIYKKALIDSLENILPTGTNYSVLSNAWDQTEKQFDEAFRAWRNKFEQNFDTERDLSVVLLGRPYVILSPELNKNIPEYFAKREVKCFFQDMVPASVRKDVVSEEILKKIPWHFAADILGAAEYCAITPGLYPVLVTAFKCAPDSIIIEFFKKILDARQKPYLILQIDEHDSSVGYETRIEAALRSFRNHSRSGHKQAVTGIPEIIPKPEHKLNGRTLMLPNWDSYSNRFLVAMLRRNGIDARLLEPDETSMRKSMAHNKGQCIPLNIIAQDFIDYIEKYELDPSKTMLWVAKSHLSCNIRMYPEFLKHLLESYGNGMEKAGVYLGHVANFELSIKIIVQSYFVYMLGGLIRKMGCMTRPYELNPGDTDRVIEDSLDLIENAFSGKGDLETAVIKMAGMFNGIPVAEHRAKPEVAIFGDFYVLDHDVVNQDLVRFIENAGGVVVTTPYHEYVKLQSENVIRRAMKRGSYQMAVLTRILIALLDRLDRKFYIPLESILGMKEKIDASGLEKHLANFNVSPYLSGESYENLLKIYHILEYHPDLSLFVQTNPAFCCPALVTEAMTRQIKTLTGVPVVTVTYDGTSESKNDIILPYLYAASEML